MITNVSVGPSRRATPSSNSELSIDKIISGDEIEFDRYFQKNIDAIRLYAFRIVGSWEDADEIASGSFLKYWEVKENYNTLSASKAFLFRCTYNACIDYLRKKKTENGVFKEYQYTVKYGEESDIRDQIRSEVLSTIYGSIQLLSPQQQLIFKLMYFDGLKGVQVAEFLDISKDTVKTQHSRIVKIFKGLFSEKDFLFYFILYLAVYTLIRLVNGL